MMTAENILTHYNFLCTNEPEKVIMGDDIDAALSTFLYLSHNPNAQLVGIYYQYQKIFFNPSIITQKELGNCIYIDLDIYHSKCRSLGHHIVRFDEKNQLKGFDNSCNINELKKYSVQNQFSKKYPLGTIHFLLWLYQIKDCKGEWLKYLLWLADSTFINAQSHRFQNNVKNWLDEFPVPFLIDSFEEVDTIDFEEKIEALQTILTKKGFEKGEGQVKSRHHQLTGFQCQPQKNATEKDLSNYIQKIFDLVASLSDWTINSEQIKVDNLTYLTLKRKSAKIATILQNIDLDAFLIENKVFSYVFPFKDSINYTHF